MNKQRGFTIFELLVVIILLIGSIGWVWNIAKIAGSDFTMLTGMLVLRCVGILVAPLGAVLGWL